MSDTKFELTIVLGNAEMRTSENVADALRAIADQVEHSGADAYSRTTRPVFDLNGNRVGAWSLELPEDENEES